MTDGPDPDSQKLNEIIAEYLQAVEVGEALSRDELLARHPDLADRLLAFLDQHEQLQRANPEPPEALGDGATIPPSDRSPDDATLALDGDRTLESGTRVRYFGDYELLEEIARGGMGVVYRARQVSLNRIVALKMILAGQLASDEDVKRFHAEAEAAANLDHPGIVPIHEVGLYEDQHYFSMGFVEGSSLAAQISDGPLPPREAAEVTRKIAEAVAFAHRHGVIHRDLKPANVLIDQSGQPRVTDFGLAKKLNEDSGLTAAGQVLGTPSYMPPEQASGKTDEVTEIADVYALGAILYALITGRPPFQAANSFDTLLQVLERDPIAPRELNPKIPQDLETICLKCLQKERHRRYASSQDLVAELQRFLNGEPILARPISALARTWRWCRRKPIVAGLIAATSGSLIAGMVVSSYFAVLASRRAEDAFSQKTRAEQALLAESKANARTQLAFVAMTRARNQARQAVDNYVDLVTTDEILRERRFQPLRRRLLDDASTYYQWLIDQSAGNRTGQLDLGKVCERLGQVHSSSGSVSEGYASARQAVQIFKDLARQDPQSVDIAQQLSGALNLLAFLAIELSRSSEAKQHYDEAINIDLALAERFPGNTDHLVDLARDYNNLGETQRRLRDAADAEQSYRRAIDIKRRLVEAEPDNEEYLNSLGNSYNNLGILEINDDARALTALKEAIRIREQLVEQHPDNAKLRNNLADSYFNLGNLSKDPSSALATYKNAQQLHDQLLRESPNVSSYRFGLAKTLLNAGTLHAKLGDTPSADSKLTHAIELHRQLIAEQPEVPEYQHSLSQCHEGRGAVSIIKKDIDAAVQHFQQAVAIQKQLAQSHPDRIRYLSALAFGNYRLGDLMYNHVGDLDAALQYWQAEAKLRGQFVQAHPDRPSLRFYLGGTLNNVAMVQEELGAVAEAARLYEQAVGHQRMALDANPKNRQARMFLSNHYSGVSRTRRKLGELSKATSAANELAQLWPDNAQQLYRAAWEMAECAQAAETTHDGAEHKIDQQTIDPIRRRAVDILEKAISAGFSDVEQLDQSEVWEPFHDDERFMSIKKRLAATSGHPEDNGP